MKLLVQSDDYGFTKGITDGHIDAFKHGFITCTGLFTNVPSCEYAVERIKDFPNICLGIDINVVSGRPVADPKLLPNLVNPETGEFIRSTEKYKDPNFKIIDLWPYEEVLIEAVAQIEKFIALTGKKPEYVHGHSISRVSPNFVNAVRDAGLKFGILYSADMRSKVGMIAMPGVNLKPFGIKEQMEADPEAFALSQLPNFLDKEWVSLGGHCGYVDDEIMKYSTYSIIRAKDHAMYTSKKIQQWFKDNHVELISYRDIKKLG